MFCLSRVFLTFYMPNKHTFYQTKDGYWGLKSTLPKRGVWGKARLQDLRVLFKYLYLDFDLKYVLITHRTPSALREFIEFFKFWSINFHAHQKLLLQSYILLWSGGTWSSRSIKFKNKKQKAKKKSYKCCQAVIKFSHTLRIHVGATVSTS